MKLKHVLAVGLVALVVSLLIVDQPRRVCAGTSRSIQLWSCGVGSDDSTAVGMADSTGLLDTGQYEHLYLVLKPNVPCRVAIQVRFYQRPAYGTTPVSSDTTTSAVWPWRSQNITTVTATVDSLTFNPSQPATTAVAANFNEMVVTFPAYTAARKWQVPNAILLPLSDANGAWYWGPMTQIRIRVLNAPSAVTWCGSLNGVTF